MKKDIRFPKVKDVFIVAAKEWNDDFTSYEWVVYLVNNSDATLEITIVVSRGQSDDRKTATLRHGLGIIAPKSSKKIEFITEEVLSFTNEYLLSYFIDGQLYDKIFTFEPHTISEKNVKPVPVLDTDGVFAD